MFLTTPPRSTFLRGTHVGDLGTYLPSPAAAVHAPRTCPAQQWVGSCQRVAIGTPVANDLSREEEAQSCSSLSTRPSIWISLIKDSGWKYNKVFGVYIQKHGHTHSLGNPWERGDDLFLSS